MLCGICLMRSMCLMRGMVKEWPAATFANNLSAALNARKLACLGGYSILNVPRRVTGPRAGKSGAAAPHPAWGLAPKPPGAGGRPQTTGASPPPRPGTPPDPQ